MSSIEMRSVAERLREPPDFLVGILGDQIGDDDARLVQHDMAERDAVGEGIAVDGHGRVRSSSRPGLVSVLNSPVAIISARTIAVVCSASISSSR